MANLTDAEIEAVRVRGAQEALLAEAEEYVRQTYRRLEKLLHSDLKHLPEEMPTLRHNLDVALQLCVEHERRAQELSKC